MFLCCREEDRRQKTIVCPTGVTLRVGPRSYDPFYRFDSIPRHRIRPNTAGNCDSHQRQPRAARRHSD
ncbi:hypothetical protein SBA3_4340002 [Candidatus Sulfopaludibacter sp. SbA3]|nr:hypothetical protein SBA3_4340002 [Candidatus Sulfopaludibacter sp. SbA3]